MVRRPPSSSIPDASGVYIFRESDGKPLYIGKAKSLRKRLANYFVADLPVRTRTMMDAAESVEWIVTDNEVAALMLEYTLVQDDQPRFNIRLRDDKSFPYLAISRHEEWPRASVMRGKRRKGVEYFGPYAHAYAIRQTLDLLLRSFPVRTCTNSKFKRHVAMQRPCLLFHIERCSGPCVGEVSQEDYKRHVDGLAAFLDGDVVGVTDRLRREMGDASDRREYERAGRIRDQLGAVERALARQELVSQRSETFDLIALEEDDLEAALVVLNVKRGRVTGRKTAIIDKVEDVAGNELVGIALGQLYGGDLPPRLVLVTELPPDEDLWTTWLSMRRDGPVALRVPQRGAKRRLMDTARANAADEFARHRLKRQSDHNARARALRSLQDHLALAQAPLRIEAFDVSTIQGRDTVGSMVVFEDGLPKKSDYRRFKVRSVSGQDDFAAMEEVLRRRFTALLAQRALPAEKAGKFAYAPSLVVIDGGAGQLGRAVRVLTELSLDIPVVGLAKRLEEVYLPDLATPLVIPRGEEALYLLQRVRDEAHRFAVTYHRMLRGKRMVDSLLDDVPGIGPTRKKLLLRRFGSLKRMRSADVDDFAGVVPDAVAAHLYAALHDGT